MTDTNIDPFAGDHQQQVNYLEAMTQKFNKDGSLDVEGLAKGKFEADKFVEQLQRENEELRQKAAQGLSAKELLEEIKRTAVVQEPPREPNQGTNPPNTDDLSKMVSDTIESRENERRQSANRSAVVQKLNEVWGSNIGSELSKRANELGVSVKRLEEIGKESPQALFAMLGVDRATTVPGSATVPTSKVTLPNNYSGERTKKYYDDLYRTNPAAKYDSKIAAQEHRDAIRLGTAFFDN